jgi:hypothetical protein
VHAFFFTPLYIFSVLALPTIAWATWRAYQDLRRDRRRKGRKFSGTPVRFRLGSAASDSVGSKAMRAPAYAPALAQQRSLDGGDGVLKGITVEQEVRRCTHLACVRAHTCRTQVAIEVDVADDISLTESGIEKANLTPGEHAVHMAREKMAFYLSASRGLQGDFSAEDSHSRGVRDATQLLSTSVCMLCNLTCLWTCHLLARGPDAGTATSASGQHAAASAARALRARARRAARRSQGGDLPQNRARFGRAHGSSRAKR